jgi:pimeloyl-ACP methyl ester carboxylesterase
MTTFVLIHGAFHGGWCWHRLAALLEARGHRALAPDLPGHGRNAAARATFRGYVEHLLALIEQEREPVILVGHSMGGGVATATAEAAPERIAKLIYLAGFLGPSGAAMSGALSSQAADDGLIPFDPRALKVMYQDCQPADVKLASLCLTPQAKEPLTAPIVWTAERYGRVPRAFIGCTRDRVYKIDDQRARAQAQGIAFHELPSGHSPFFSMPERLADLLEGLGATGGETGRFRHGTAALPER